MANWEIVSGVGITALGVAGARAIESRRPDGLVADPYAEAFVRAAQAPTPIPTTSQGAESDPGLPWHALATYIGVRSKFFDGFFARTSTAGIRQMVILAAGLDSRALRLRWLPGTTVYEVDSAGVLEFKDRVFCEQGAHPRCERRPVAADLRGDWQAALRRAGFDPDRPTAWLAEGLLGYLADDAKDGLLTGVQDLSASGSGVALEYNANVTRVLGDPDVQQVASRVDFDFIGLWPADQRLDPARWLTGRGWAVSVEPIAAVAESYRRPLDARLPALRSTRLITASRNL